MAKPVSSIESHPQRQRIIEAIVSGRPYSEIEAWSNPSVNRGALSRFKSRAIAVQDQAVRAAKSAIANSVTDLGGVNLQAVQRAAMTVAVDPFLSAVEQLRTDRARIKGKAETSGDLRAWVSADGNDLKSLELHARLAGRLDQPTQQTNIMIVCPAGELHGSADTSRAGADTDAVIIDIGAKR